MIVVKQTKRVTLHFRSATITTVSRSTVIGSYNNRRQKFTNVSVYSFKCTDISSVVRFESPTLPSLQHSWKIGQNECVIFIRNMIENHIPSLNVIFWSNGSLSIVKHIFVQFRPRCHTQWKHIHVIIRNIANNVLIVNYLFIRIVRIVLHISSIRFIGYTVLFGYDPSEHGCPRYRVFVPLDRQGSIVTNSCPRIFTIFQHLSNGTIGRKGVLHHFTNRTIYIYP